MAAVICPKAFSADASLRFAVTKISANCIASGELFTDDVPSWAWTDAVQSKLNASTVKTRFHIFMARFPSLDAMRKVMMLTKTIVELHYFFVGQKRNGN